MFVLLAVLLTADPTKPPGPPEFEVQFASGSTLRQVAVLTDSITMSTKYGTLTIPVADLRRVELGKGDKATDTVEAVEYTARGKVERAELKVKTAEFGESTLKMTALKSLRYTPAGGRAADLAVDAAKNGRANWAEWLDTGIEVAAGEPVEITATGTVDLSPQNAGTQTTGPAGGGPPAPQPPGGDSRPPGGSRVGSRPWWMSGQLVGRIGTGKPFPVDAAYKGPAPAAGRLFLIIAPSGFGHELAGGYKVVVRVGG